MSVDDDTLAVDLVDGRRVIVPLAWFPRLLRAKPSDRRTWRLVGDGQGINGPEIDEDLSVEGLLRGVDAPGASRGTA